MGVGGSGWRVGVDVAVGVAVGGAAVGVGMMVAVEMTVAVGAAVADGRGVGDEMTGCGVGVDWALALQRAPIRSRMIASQIPTSSEKSS